VAFSACVQSCLMTVVVKTSGVILLVVPKQLTLPPHATAFCPVFTRAIESPKRGGTRLGRGQDGQRGTGLPVFVNHAL
jgi:hypothetical protein